MHDLINVPLSWWECLPFVGLLLSLSLFPVLWGEFWHHHYGKVVGFWGVVIALLVVWDTQDLKIVTALFSHTIIKEYIPFIVLIGTLFILSGGIHMTLKGHAHPLTNGLILLIGAIFSNFLGTTGAATLFIRPLLKINQFRHHKAHIVIFFIFLVGNIGGCLTPIGDPPLFIGYLLGVDFFWPLQYLWAPYFFIVACVLGLFLIFDGFYYAKEKRTKTENDEEEVSYFSLKGKRNIPLILMVPGIIVLSGYLSIPQEVRDIFLVLLAITSYLITPKTYYHYNHFSFEPLKEIVKVFLSVFITVAPVIVLLKQGDQGAFAGIIDLLKTNSEFSPLRVFWISGSLSSVLDNAPTYMVFFNALGGNAIELMSSKSLLLVAVSLGSVFMGAMTYIGNAPNYMVKAIAEHQHVKMPNFFVYMIWSSVILLPILFLLTIIFL